jgi:hypothetical protein
MNIILSIILILTPVWDIQLRPLEIPAHIQTELKLKKSQGDRYIVLSFNEVKSLLIFKESAEAGSKNLTLCKDLTRTLEVQAKALRESIQIKDEQIRLMTQNIKILREAVAPREDTWKISLIVLTSLTLGYITFDLISD